MDGLPEPNGNEKAGDGAGLGWAGPQQSTDSTNISDKTWTFSKVG